MKPALIFDFGGVLMRTLDYTPRHRWDEQLGLPLGSVERVVHGGESWRLAQTGTISPEAYWSDVGQQLGLTAEQTRQLAVDFFSGDQLDEALVAFIRQLRAAGHRTALLSNDSPALLEKLQMLQIADLFDPLVISAFIGVMKPDARAYQTVLDRLGITPAQAIFIDDLPRNVAGAQAVGIIGLHYTTLDQLRRDLDSLIRQASGEL
ncbi:MAG: HAD family phosphatase [Anaerolineae bacterium]|nr:HAD family phosphatase [Anaerolineae bacterium]